MKKYVFAVTFVTGVVLTCMGFGHDESEALANAAEYMAVNDVFPLTEIKDISLC
jgi:hypothetical protein